MEEPDGRRRRTLRSRQRIVAVATRRFLEHGYAATTIGDIARDAGVAPQTVYYDFGTKPNVLAAVVDVAIVGDDVATPVIDRSWAEQLAGLTDPDEALAHLARGSVEILARVAPVYEVLSRAATDPDVGRLLARVREGRRRDQRALVESLAAAGHLRRGLDVAEAADIVYALVNEEVYLMLVGDCGWTPEQLRTWLTATLGQQLR